MCFKNLPIEFDDAGNARLLADVPDPYSVTTSRPEVGMTDEERQESIRALMARNGHTLSPEAEQGLGRALDIVRAEVRRAPLLVLAGRLRDLLDGDGLESTPAVQTLRDLLDELDVLDREGRWGRTFAERDRLRLRIADGQTGEGMDHLDWGLWWALIEELDRLERLEAARSG